MKTKNNYTEDFKNWFNELQTENEGRRIANSKTIEQLEELFTRATGKSPFKK